MRQMVTGASTGSPFYAVGDNPSGPPGLSDDAVDGDGSFDWVTVFVEADVSEDAVLDVRLEQLFGD